MFKRTQLEFAAKEIIPPILIRFLNRNSEYGFSGDYKTWKEAQSASTGYDSEIILTKVKDSLLKVKNGIAVHERDSVLFDEIEYSWPLLAGLLKAAVDNGGRLKVLDFGGSLGTTYFQYRKFLFDLVELEWNVVEQKKFVDCGKIYFENKNLIFYQDMETCIQKGRPNVIVLSGVIQYIEKPYELLEKIVNKGIEYILFDRTPFIEGNKDLLTVQKVNPEIYRASYPAWFFNRNNFLNVFNGKYELIASFDALDREKIPSKFEGFIFKIKSTVKAK